MPIKRDINILIVLLVSKSKSNPKKGEKIIIGKHVIIQVDKDLERKIVSKGSPEI